MNIYIMESSSNKENIERCKKLLLSNPVMPMLSIKNIAFGSIGTVIPWTILLIIVGIIIII